jgi:hypothetical protein
MAWQEQSGCSTDRPLSSYISLQLQARADNAVLRSRSEGYQLRLQSSIEELSRPRQLQLCQEPRPTPTYMVDHFALANNSVIEHTGARAAEAAVGFSFRQS